MTAGKLRHRVTVQAPTTTQDAANQPIPAWADEATVWGLYEPLGAYEAEAAGRQVRSVVSGKVTVRRRDGLTAAKRLVVSGWGVDAVTLNIVGVMQPDPATGMAVVLVREPDALREEG